MRGHMTRAPRGFTLVELLIISAGEAVAGSWARRAPVRDFDEIAVEVSDMLSFIEQSSKAHQFVRRSSPNSPMETAQANRP